MSSETVPMVEKSSTPIDDAPKEPVIANNVDNSEPQQAEGASPGEEPKYPKLSDPSENEPKKPDGNPFAHLFKVLSDKDMAQCKAWEDEVQNILIFAALFSAVVTAFIIESYQRLQPDPNDVVVNLLAHIAQRMDGVPVNGTPSVSSILSGNNFVPTQADIRINVAWFISLILSLTAALIGIVTLQWLREHRQYPSWNPKDKLGILNMRMESLERWYVPQIFASLPLFVQGALIFFFAGIIELLFGLSTKVAIPAAICICIPLSFVLATTMFPLIQICFLMSPRGLPSRTGVPSPCPYKSPQSISFRHIGTLILTWFARADDSINREFIGTYRPQTVYDSLLCSDWTSMDKKWLEIRANYATLSQLPPDDEASWYKLSLDTVDQDAVLVFRRVMNLGLAETDVTALYHCMKAGYAQFVRHMLSLEKVGNANLHKFVSSILSLIPRTADFAGHRTTNSFFQHIITDIDAQSEVTELLSTTLLLLSLNRLTFSRYMTRKLWMFLGQVTSRVILQQLNTHPRTLFLMDDRVTWFPDELWWSGLRALFDPIIRQHATSLFHNFLKKCAQPHPVTALRPYAHSYGAAERFMEAVVLNQSIKDTNLTLVHLQTLCNNATPRERPFLFLAACFYMDRLSYWNTHRTVIEPDLKPVRDNLLDLLCLQCNVTERGFDQFGEWEGLEEAVRRVCDAYTNTPEEEEPPQIEPDTSDTQPQADPTIEFNPDASREV